MYCIIIHMYLQVTFLDALKYMFGFLISFYKVYMRVPFIVILLSYVPKE